MPALIVTVDEESLCKDIKNLVRNTVEYCRGDTQRDTSCWTPISPG